MICAKIWRAWTSPRRTWPLALMHSRNSSWWSTHSRNLGMPASIKSMIWLPTYSQHSISSLNTSRSTIKYRRYSPCTKKRDSSLKNCSKLSFKIFKLTKMHPIRPKDKPSVMQPRWSKSLGKTIGGNLDNQSTRSFWSNIKSNMVILIMPSSKTLKNGSALLNGRWKISIKSLERWSQ